MMLASAKFSSELLTGMVMNIKSSISAAKAACAAVAMTYGGYLYFNPRPWVVLVGVACVCGASFAEKLRADKDHRMSNSCGSVAHGSRRAHRSIQRMLKKHLQSARAVIQSVVGFRHIVEEDRLKKSFEVVFVGQSVYPGDNSITREEAPELWKMVDTARPSGITDEGAPYVVPIVDVHHNTVISVVSFNPVTHFTAANIPFDAIEKALASVRAKLIFC